MLRLLSWLLHVIWNVVADRFGTFVLETLEVSW